MSAKYTVSPAALDDIDELTRWMRKRDPDSDFDLRFIDALYKSFAFLAAKPRSGHRRPDLTNLPVLFWPVMKSFAVIYRAGPPVEIVRVTRWARDIPRLLSDDHG